MAEHDTDPLTPEERAELEELRAEKAQREADERARRERAELAELRAQKAAASAKSAASAGSRQASKPKAAPAQQSREDMSFGMRMVSSTKPADDDDIPGMPPAQKLIIAICLVAVLGFAIYIGLGNAGILR